MGGGGGGTLWNNAAMAGRLPVGQLPGTITAECEALLAGKSVMGGIFSVVSLST